MKAVMFYGCDLFIRRG